MIPRLIEKVIFERLTHFNKIILILGARQVGKTTLIKSIAEQLRKEDKNVLYLNCDLDEDRISLDTTSLTLLGNLTKGVDYLFIDEAQRLENPGLTLKIIYDNLRQTKVIATGSSAFELKNKVSDALTGRFLDFHLFPLSLTEILQNGNVQDNKSVMKNTADALLNQTLTYGLYPEIYSSGAESDKKLLLEKIVESYLFKDILSFQSVRNPKAIMDLTKALAYQIGSEISENELASRLKIDRKTVASYLDILEKSFIIIRLYPYSKNPRREIGKNYKIYYSDLGLRNELIGDFNAIDIRQDAGRIWENFLLIERLKMHANAGNTINYNFWRTYSGAEVDYLERKPDISAFEFKYASQKKSRGANIFAEKYNTKIDVIHKDNYLDFIM
jgi:hypothetical protein